MAFTPPDGDHPDSGQDMPFDAEALLRLMTLLGATADATRLRAACAADRPPGAGTPAERLRMLLTSAGIKGPQASQLRWRRLDLARLPVLVLHQGQWRVAERDAPGQVRLSGQTGTIADDALQNAPVLWLRLPRAAGTAGPALIGNRAATLVWRELFDQPGWVAQALAATLIVNLLAVASSVFAMQVYDRVVPTLAYATLATLVAGMAMIIILDWILRVIRARILDSMASAVDKRVSQQVFDHMLRLRLDLQPRSLGTLAAQVGGLESVRQFLSSGVVFALVDMPFALLFIGFVALIGGPLAAIYLVLLTIAVLLGLVTQLRLRRLLREEVQRGNERQGMLVDAIRGAESIRAGNAGWRFSEQWRDITASIAGYAIQHKSIASVASVSTAALSSIAYVLVIVGGVWLIEGGRLTTGGLIACSILGGRVIAPVAQAVQYLIQWQGVSQSLRMVDQVLGLPCERGPEQTLLVPDGRPREIRLEQLRFGYQGTAVRRLDIPALSLRAGDRVLVLGPVGCGKSTLLKVLAGLYRPGEGRVRLGEADLWETDPQVVAAHVGYLPQSTHLFKGSLKSNLSLSGTASDSAVLGIARALGVDAIAASSPQGMDLDISEGGDGLSGGQRQLVAMARVAIGAPTVWLLDEPTASLDGDSETKVWQLLADRVGPDDILVVATHRPLQALRLANRVMVMQEGRIVRDGPPARVVPQLARAAGLDVPASAPTTTTGRVAEENRHVG